MFDMDMGYPCDHLVRYFCTLYPAGVTNAYLINLRFPLPLAGTVVGYTPVQGTKAVFLASRTELFLNEELYPSAEISQRGQKLLQVQDTNPSVDLNPAAYPLNDFEISHTSDPLFCPKCKGQTPFG